MRWLAVLLIILAGPLRAGVPAVVTDLPPVHSLAAAVMAGLGDPVLLVDGTASPHNAQLRPSQARALAAADLVVWMGPELTPWLDRARAGIAPDTPTLTLLDAAGTIQRAPLFSQDRDSGHDEDHAHDHDPHAWLDPANALVWTDAIAAALAGADPEHAAAYRANAAMMRAEIEAAANAADQLLRPMRGTPLVVQHDAYAHFAARFQLNITGSLADSAASAPGAGSVADLGQAMRREHVTCVLAEAQENPRMATRLAEDTGATLATLDPLGSTLPPGPALYPALILELADTIAGCAAR